MPIADCGFRNTDQLSGLKALLQFGPTLWVDMGFDPTFDYAKGSLTGALGPQSSATQIPALVDTGATFSCIDNNLALSLGLPFVDRQNISGVGGEHELNVYLAHVIAPALRWGQWGLFYGVKLAEGQQPHRALIGRFFLQTMMLIYDGRTGHVEIAV